jgi:hypothetical protein
MKCALLASVVASVASVAFSFGCGGGPTRATSIRLGTAPRTTLPPSCTVRFEDIRTTEAAKRYEHLGYVALERPSDEPRAWDGATREKLTPRVCDLGGSIVTLSLMMDHEPTENWGTGHVQFAVWRERVTAMTPDAGVETR